MPGGHHMSTAVRRTLSAAVAAAMAIAGLALAQGPATGASGNLTVPNTITTQQLGGSLTPASLAQQLMSADGSMGTVTNVTYTGSPIQARTVVVNDPVVVGFTNGIILSSGNIADAVGPNSSEGITTDVGATDQAFGKADPDLNTLISGSQTVYPMTFDSASLEFDVVPVSSTLYFTYVFGSDEYMEWVNLYNDVFAFWVTDSATGVKTNCATVPGAAGADPVSIYTVNANVNPSLYRNNSTWFDPATNPLNIESDGISVELICKASVSAGKPAHIKLAIADTSDQILDSIVMIKAHSFSTTAPESCNNGVDDEDVDSVADEQDPECQALGSAPTATNTPNGATVSTTVTFSGASSTSDNPPFTGAEGQPIPLDAQMLGVTKGAIDGLAEPGTPGVFGVSTSWTINPINGSTGTCFATDASGVQLVAPAALTDAGDPAIAYAICSNNGEYTARVDVWDNEGHSMMDTDVDFFVQDAPPQVTGVTVDLPQATTDDTVVAAGFVGTYGTDDSVTSCSISFGDGSPVVDAPLGEGGLCSASHQYSATGVAKISVIATDSDGSTGAAVVPVSITEGSMAQQTITASGPASAAYGTTFTITASSDNSAANAPALTYSSTGPCSSAVGASFTMTKGLGTCIVTVSQPGDATHLAAKSVDVQVPAALRPLTIAAANKTKVSGQADPVLTASIASGTLAAGDTVSTTSTRAPGEAVGSYPITVATYPIVNGTTPVTGNYMVTTTPGTLIITAPLPAIGSFTPTTGGPGTPVTIAGSNLTGATSVKFGTAAAPFTVLSATSILTSVPAFTAASSVALSVTTPSGTATSTATFSATTTKKAPTVTTLTPAFGAPGSTVTITGTNLAGVTSASLGTVAMTNVKVLSATSLTATVPSAADGAISIVTAGGTGKSSSTFDVAPYATSLTYGGSTSLTRNTALTLKATLKQTSGGALLAGQTVTFSYVYATKTYTYTAVTNASGVATVTPAPLAPNAAATLKVTVSFAAAGTYSGSTATGTVTVK